MKTLSYLVISPRVTIASITEATQLARRSLTTFARTRSTFHGTRNNWRLFYQKFKETSLKHASVTQITAILGFELILPGLNSSKEL